jgi:hypothetical protein
MEVALSYRSLFLENNSPFTPTMFKFLNPKDMKTTVSGLLKELRILFVRGKEARLEDRVNIVALFGVGSEAANVVQEMMKEWEEEKQQLNLAAENFVRLIQSSPSLLTKYAALLFRSWKGFVSRLWE